jgi:hypothetical protein
LRYVIASIGQYYGYRAGDAFGGDGRWRNRSNNDVHLGFRQLSGEPIKPIIVLVGKSVHQFDVLALCIAKIVQPFAQSTEEYRFFLFIARVPQNADPWDFPDCCARAASGHTAAPPRAAMNARRFIR